MMLAYDDEIMKDDDWLYEDDSPKKKGGYQPVGKMQPPEWTLKGCETVDDPAEKERLRKELEKKERRRQQNREAQKRWQEKKKAEKEAAKEREKTEQPKMTFADVAEELKQMDEPDVDTSLERLAKLRELAETEQAETTETENTTTEFETVTTEEPTEIVTEPAKIVSEAPDSVSDQEVVVAEIAPAIEDDITLVLTTSEAESLFLFIREELLTVVKRDDVDELDWLVDMCSIYSGLRKVLIQNG